MKRGILIAAFGSSNPQVALTLAGFERRVRSANPGTPVRWAFTSGVIRKRLAGEGVKTDSVAKALRKMAFEQYTHVAVSTLLMAPGAEYEALTAEADALVAEGVGLERVAVAEPLLAAPGDLEASARAMIAGLPRGRAADEAVLFMGHGTWHAGDARYDSLMEAVRPLDPLVFLGTMEGSRTLDGILDELRAAGARRVWLKPFLAVAGRHVMHDMAGKQPDSWASRLAAAGFDCEIVPHGAAEDEGLAGVWLDHLAEAVRSLPAE